MGPDQSLTTDSLWDAVEVGTLNLNDYFTRSQIATPGSLDLLEIEIADLASGDQVDFDFFLLHFSGDRFLIHNNDDTISAATDIRIIGAEQAVIDEDGSREIYMGEFWDIPPGNQMSRAVFSLKEPADLGAVHLYDDDWVVFLTLTPRTRHLLGT
jgi:hypothetical protein